MNFSMLGVMILDSMGSQNLDWADSVDDKTSTFGYVFNLGSGAVTWTNKKQHVVSLSSIEEEYRAAIKVACEASWLHWMLADLHLSQVGLTTLLSNN